MFKKLFVLSVVALAAIVFSACGNSEQKQIDAIVQNQAIADGAALEQIAGVIFGDTMKAAKAEKGSEGGELLAVIVKYGQEDAQTTLTKETIQNVIVKEIARNALRVAKAGRDRKLGILGISLNLPMLNEEGKTEAKEVYRVSLRLQQLSAIPDWDKTPVSAEAVEKLQQIWSVDADNLDSFEVE